MEVAKIELPVATLHKLVRQLGFNIANGDFDKDNSQPNGLLERAKIHKSSIK